MAISYFGSQMYHVYRINMCSNSIPYRIWQCCSYNIYERFDQDIGVLFPQAQWEHILPKEPSEKS